MYSLMEFIMMQYSKDLFHSVIQSDWFLWDEILFKVKWLKITAVHFPGANRSPTSDWLRTDTLRNKRVTSLRQEVS